MKTVIELTKEEILNYLTTLDPLKDKKEFDEWITRFSPNSSKLFHFIVVGELPTYDEYFLEYKKYSKLLNEIYIEQIKSLHKFEQWLYENKTKTFTHEELEEKMLELKLSYKGFNGGIK